MEIFRIHKLSESHHWKHDLCFLLPRAAECTIPEVKVCLNTTGKPATVLNVSSWTPYHHNLDGRQVLRIWPSRNSLFMCSSMWMGKYKPHQGLLVSERRQVSSAHLQFNSIDLWVTLTRFILKRTCHSQIQQTEYWWTNVKAKRTQSLSLCAKALSKDDCCHILSLEEVRNKHSGICIRV